jgi:predicted transcriptional regulator of viral defense system
MSILCAEQTIQTMNTIITYLRKNKGYARMKEMKESGFQTREIHTLVKAGSIVKVRPGMYRLANIQLGESHGIVEVCLAMQKAVICLSSALAYHGLTTFMPTSISYAIPRSDKPINLAHPPTEVYYFSQSQYVIGIEVHETKAGRIRIYGAEKTICDCFRFRHTLGEDIALEGLKTYLRRRNRNLDTLMKLARTCRVESILSHYVKAIVG